MAIATHRHLTAFGAVTGLLAGAVLFAPGTATAATPAGRVLKGSHPAWASAAADRGAVSASLPVTSRVYLADADPAGLASYAGAVSDPASASYGAFLTPDQVRQRFGAAPGSVATVSSWATAAGLRVTATTAEYVEVAGSAAAVGKAFGTTLHNYATAQGTRQAPSTDLVVPQAISGSLLTVTGLAASPGFRPSATPTPGGQARPTTNPSRSVPIGHQPVCSEYYGQKLATGIPTAYTSTTPYLQCGLVPSQLRKAYGVAGSGYTGKGVTIAITDAYGTSTMRADANRYATNHGDKKFKTTQYSEMVTPGLWKREDECGGPEGWAAEESLDVEMAHGLAPNANILYVGANSCFEDDFLDALNTIIDGHLADIVSNSWLEILHSSEFSVDPGLLTAYSEAFQRGAAEGISFTFASGDCGDADPVAAQTGGNCDPSTLRPQTEWPASDPWVTAVGATALALSSKAGRYGFETNMGDSYSFLSDDRSYWDPFPGIFYFGSGGGTSEDYDQPAYQSGVVPDDVAHTLLTGEHTDVAKRAVPDVAMHGDLAWGTEVGFSAGAPYSEAAYGGSSVSCPLFAAFLADAIQARQGAAFGLANPVLYDKQALFRDLVDPAQPISSVDVYPTAGTDPLEVLLWKLADDYGLHAVAGYDTATGLGSPNAQLLQSFATG